MPEEPQNVATFWCHLERVAEDGRWEALEYGVAPMRVEAELADVLCKNFQDVPAKEVGSLNDGW